MKIKLKDGVIVTWEFLRKPTTPVHLLYGLFCVFMVWQFGILTGAVLMLAFAVWEFWNDYELLARDKLLFGANPIPADHVAKAPKAYLPEGAMDFWESTVSFCIAFFALGVLQAQGIVSIGWLP